VRAVKKTALVTGANKGLGFETALQLAQQGYTVWVGARDRARGEKAVDALSSAGDVRFVSLDVTDEASISRAAAHLEATTGALDVLVNNAGVAVSDGEGRPSTVEVGTLQRTLDVNVYGAIRVTQTFLPLLRRADAGRIVNVSSTLGSLGILTSPGSPFTEIPAFAYTSSKTLLNALTGWLAIELAATSIKVNSVCPGHNATDMNGGGGAQHPAEGAKVVVRAATLGTDGPTGTFFDVDGTLPW
jgi:NAD(P)-dependent dehydrogenase (short-subunit alcohol dehydrogenase family)